MIISVFIFFCRNDLDFNKKLLILLRGFSKALKKVFTLNNLKGIVIGIIIALIIGILFNINILLLISCYYKVKGFIILYKNFDSLLYESNEKKLESIFTHMLTNLFNEILTNNLIKSMKWIWMDLLQLINIIIVWMEGGGNSGLPGGGSPGGEPGGGSPGGGPGGGSPGGGPGGGDWFKKIIPREVNIPKKKWGWIFAFIQTRKIPAKDVKF